MVGRMIQHFYGGIYELAKPHPLNETRQSYLRKIMHKAKQTENVLLEEARRWKSNASIEACMYILADKS